MAYPDTDVQIEANYTDSEVIEPHKGIRFLQYQINFKDRSTDNDFVYKSKLVKLKDIDNENSAKQVESKLQDNQVDPIIHLHLLDTLSTHLQIRNSDVIAT